MKRIGLCLLLAAFAALPAVAQEAETFVDGDQELAEFAQQVPSFAGYFYDEAGQLVVQTTDLAQKAALDQVFAEAGEIRYRQADYGFGELYEARVKLTDVLSEAGASYLDIDEVRNRIVIGIDQGLDAAGGLFADAENAHQAVGARFGVDPAMIEVIPVDPVVSMLTLRQRTRPVPGGMQINFGNFVCTLGFVIKQGSTNGFVTNSHCTNTQGGVESTAYFQPSGSSNRIATEIKDPRYTTGSGCPAGRRCRVSDSAMARFQNNRASLGQFKKVAKPTSRNTGSITIANGGSARFTLTGKGSAAVGNTVRKVGRTTGWTQGRVSNTCVLTNNENNKTFFCQTFVTAGVGGGDSGSGVLKGRTAVGLLWGGNAAGTLFVYSPISQVQQDLGGFRVH